ncbi:hypothetical protein SLS62_004311 [Diatrype stigma]|uniref:Aminoglycoside phosphotransferase domain-containing protein n=1 Tax=Diatrype stigma TaxID=117547 RepID=A0AAN9V394_9PEZI
MAGPVRHPIDVAALERYLSEHVPEIELPLDVKQFGFGQSNPTYQLTSRATGARYVLRKKPPGRLLSQSAHKVEREHRVIAALWRGGTGVPVPRPYALCEDAAVLGTPFYVMQFLDGRIFEDPYMRLDPTSSGKGKRGEEVPASERAALWRAAVETLARLHAVDREAVGLQRYGKGEDGGFYARQVETWRRICEAQARAVDAETGRAVGHLPHFEDLLAFFRDEAQQPGRSREPSGGGPRATLVHGDYKIDNLVFHPTEPRVIGILDWEMSTVGHPLSDLANLLHPFYGAGPEISSGSTTAKEKDPVSVPEGLPTPSTIVAWYGAAAGWEVPEAEMAWATAFSVFRLSAICQGIAARVATRQASSAEARRHAEAMGPLAERAWSMVVAAKAKAKSKGKGDKEEEGETKAKL